MDSSKILELKIADHLSEVLGYFEVHCVAGCCGLDAFDFDPIYACHAIAEHGSERMEAAISAVDSSLAAIHAIPEDWSVMSGRLNTIWTKTDALAFFEMLKKDFHDALAIGPVGVNQPHPRHDFHQRFTRG